MSGYKNKNNKNEYNINRSNVNDKEPNNQDTYEYQNVLSKEYFTGIKAHLPEEVQF